MHCREAPPIAVGKFHTLFVDADCQLLACGLGDAAGHSDTGGIHADPTPFADIAAIRVHSVAAGLQHSLALGCNRRVYSWGGNNYRQLGHRSKRARHAPKPKKVKWLKGVWGIAEAAEHSLAVTQNANAKCCCLLLEPCSPKWCHE
jgi:alpha-tubulin suppressor-like RCC1 family protein